MHESWDWKSKERESKFTRYEIIIPLLSVTWMPWGPWQACNTWKPWQTWKACQPHNHANVGNGQAWGCRQTPQWSRECRQIDRFALRRFGNLGWPSSKDKPTQDTHVLLFQIILSTATNRLNKRTKYWRHRGAFSFPPWWPEPGPIAIIPQWHDTAWHDEAK